MKPWLLDDANFSIKNMVCGGLLLNNEVVVCHGYKGDLMLWFLESVSIYWQAPRYMQVHSFGGLNVWALGFRIQLMPFGNCHFIGPFRFEAKNLLSLFHLHSSLGRGNI